MYRLAPKQIDPAANHHPWAGPGRIRFSAGTTSATVIGILQPEGADRYVLRALASQTLIVDITAPHPVLLSVWGADGTVLKREVGGTTWNEAYGFEMQYPSDFVVEVNCDPAAVIGDPKISFRLMGTLYYAGTNLVEACVITAASRSAEARLSCPEPRIPYEEYLFRFTE